MNLCEDRDTSPQGVFTLFKDKKCTTFANKYLIVLVSQGSRRVNRFPKLRCCLEQVRRLVGRPCERSEWSFCSTSDDNFCISTLDGFGPFNKRIRTTCPLGDKGSGTSFYAK